MCKNRVAIIGAGAAGLFASAVANIGNNRITLFEKNAFAGKKLLITGKGRCNVTSASDIKEFFNNIPVNPKFLYSCLNSFTNVNTMEFFEGLGVPLKTERGERVFPVSDSARDIRDALLNKALDNGVNLVYECVRKISKSNGKFTVITDNGEYLFDKVIIATGGVSYQLTGSTGDGYDFASAFLHTIIPPKPSLVPLVCREGWCKALMGLSLKNVSMKVFDSRVQKYVYEDFGEMLFTHYGISGPMVLSASSHLRDISSARGIYTVHLDLKPALDFESLDKRLLSDFAESKNKDFINSLNRLFPSKLIPVIVGLSTIPAHKKVNEITRQERQDFVSLIKNFKLTVLNTRPIGEAIITSGGVSTSEINPRTMESKIVEGLYFAGEVIDVDAYTGGFNLQIAFSTAYAAINDALK